MATSLETLLYAHLSVDAGVLAALGRDPAGNITLYRVQLPPGTTGSAFPACAFQRIATVPLYTHSQNGNPNGSVGWARFQFTVWATGASSGNLCDTAIRAIIASLATFNGQGATYPGAPNFVLNRSEHIEANVDPPLFKQICDVRVFYQDQ